MNKQLVVCEKYFVFLKIVNGKKKKIILGILSEVIYLLLLLSPPNRTVMGIITMNPGYAGRATLPEGLKALFRPMTVMVPDMVLICENMLMAEGFTEAKVLASKFYGLYALLRDLLSAQKHYDWGLRAVKSVLRVAGSMLRAEPELDEAVRTTNDFALFIVLVDLLNVSDFFFLTKGHFNAGIARQQYRQNHSRRRTDFFWFVGRSVSGFGPSA